MGTHVLIHAFAHTCTCLRVHYVHLHMHVLYTCVHMLCAFVHAPPPPVHTLCVPRSRDGAHGKCSTQRQNWGDWEVAGGGNGDPMEGWVTLVMGTLRRGSCEPPPGPGARRKRGGGRVRPGGSARWPNASLFYNNRYKSSTLRPGLRGGRGGRQSLGWGSGGSPKVQPTALGAPR